MLLVHPNTGQADPGIPSRPLLSSAVLIAAALKRSTREPWILHGYRTRWPSALLVDAGERGGQQKAFPSAPASQAGRRLAWGASRLSPACACLSRAP